MEFLSNSSTLFKPDIFPADPFLLLLPGLNFDCRSVPPSNQAVFQERVVTKQEPPVQPIFSQNPGFDFKRDIPGDSEFASKSHLLHVLGVNYPTDYFRRLILIKCQAGVLQGDTIGVNPFAVWLQHNDQLGNEINQLQEFLIDRVKLARRLVEDSREVGEFIVSANRNLVLKGPSRESLGALYQVAQRNRDAPRRGKG